jgi:hypothetical protein
MSLSGEEQRAAMSLSGEEQRAAMTWQNSGTASRAGDPYTATDQLDPDERNDASYDQVVYYQDPTRWRWVAAGAALVLVLAVIGTVVILRSGDRTSTSTRIVPPSSPPVASPPVTTRPLPSATTTPPTPPPPPPPPPETVTTVTPSVTASAQAPPTTSESGTRSVTYTISGTRRPGDFVTVTYIDATGVPRTDFNVTLPWAKTVTPAGAMLLRSVTAVSLASHLNCSITDADGQTITSQGFNAIATTCNR